MLMYIYMHVYGKIHLFVNTFTNVCIYVYIHTAHKLFSSSNVSGENISSNKLVYMCIKTLTKIYAYVYIVHIYVHMYMM